MIYLKYPHSLRDSLEFGRSPPIYGWDSSVPQHYLWHALFSKQLPLQIIPLHRRYLNTKPHCCCSFSWWQRSGQFRWSLDGHNSKISFNKLLISIHRVRDILECNCFATNYCFSSCVFSDHRYNRVQLSKKEIYSTHRFCMIYVGSLAFNFLLIIIKPIVFARLNSIFKSE